jgi:hypothetical protein
VKKHPENPSEEDNRRKNFNDNNLGVEDEAVKVERPFAAGPETKGELWHTISYFSRLK